MSRYGSMSGRRTFSGTRVNTPISAPDGQKYPELKERGFYSDILGEGAHDRLGDPSLGPRKTRDTTWAVGTEKATPSVNSFDGPTEKSALTDGKEHGPTTQLTAIQDFAEKSYKPKVQLPFITEPGKCPRKIEIERQKRHNLHQNLYDLFVSECIDIGQLMPKNQPDGAIVMLNADVEEPAPFPAFLPLDIFDNTEYEMYNPNEWLQLGYENGVRKPVPGKALLPTRDDVHHLDPKDPSIEYKMLDVGILDYDADTKLYFVQKVNSAGRILDQTGQPVVDGGKLPNGNHMNLPTQYWIPRIRLMFSAEDPARYVHRVAEAFRARKYTESILRYNLYVDNMPMEGVGELDSASLRRITEWAKGPTVLAKDKRLDDYIQVFEKEINIDFCRSMNKIIFDKIVSENSVTLAFITVPEQRVVEVPEKGCWPDVPAYPFDEQYDSFAFHSLLTRVEVIQAIGKVKTECNKVISMSLFHIPVPKHMKLEEFEQTQSQATSQVALFLKDSWITTLRTAIRSSLFDIGKGWFNLKETRWEVYKISKMKCLMEMVKYCMQDSLRYLVQDSLTNFTQMVIDACYSTYLCKEDLTWGSDLINSPYKPKRNPLFIVDLQIDHQGVHYSTPLPNFETVLLSLFNKGIQSTQSVPQLEKYIMEDIFWSGTPLLESVGENEPHIRKLRKKVRRAIRKALVPMNAYAKEYEKYLEMSNLDINSFIKNYEGLNKPAVDFKTEIEVLLQKKDEIENILPSSLIIGPFLVNTENVRQNLSKKYKALASSMLDSLAKKLRKQADDACEDFKAISRKLFEKPNCIEELSELREWMKGIPDAVAEKEDIIKKVLEDYELLDEFYYNLSTDDFNTKWSVVGWPNNIEKTSEKVQAQLLEDEERFRKLQLSDQTNFNDRLDNIAMLVANMAAYTDISKAHETANEIRRVYKQLKDAQADAQKYANRERLFGLPVTNYDKLGRLVKDFEPFRSLWITTSDWLRWHESWMNDPLSSIDAESVDKNVNESFKTMHKSVKHFADMPGVIEVAQEIKKQIEDFRPYIPLIQGLRNPGMRNRHWELLSEELGFPLRPKADLTFAKCLEKNLQKYITTIAKVAEVAGKEYAIEQALDKMESEWASVNFEMLAYKDTGTYILKVGEEISQQLDDHIVMTQSMSFSPFKKPFEDRINAWENKLKITQDVLDEWLQCQRQWLYLEPIFSSEDINRQLPVEGKRYQTMERMWRKIMKQAKENPNVISLCPDQRLLANLQECNKLLEQVQKGLSEYLETKRTSFPRFYFLSDDELLEILSQTKEPTAVQPHLRKCFENIAKVKFEADSRISQMFSAEGEMVPLKVPIYPIGNVEDWMLSLENGMKNSLREIMREALEDYVKTPRKQWVLMWPGQIVIAGCQTMWTAEVTAALEQNDLSTLFPKLLAQLDDLRDLVTDPNNKSFRQILSPLIVIEVHSRDVVDNMIKENTKNVNDFEWIKQLRYYWMEESLYMKAVNAQFPYGFEYLGNSGRLVITPLTDRCYLTLTGALHLKFGGAPAGPAGTGKTETVKDLGKAMAVQCVVFNCSDQLDFMAMGKFFKGLASAGAWACFDEFNRIDIEVLSVVAQQITTIQKAQQQRVDRFMFENQEIVLKASCAIFITMNPGYAGRTELPDNLKALFRPVAMMVPDYALIAEISLFSFGFRAAKGLSEKIVSTFKLSSEQLSSQDHYDFGMRAVKSVISAAGNLKRQYPTMDEDLVCLRAIRDVNVPKFLADDLKLFNGIVSDLFPQIKEVNVEYGGLDDSIRKAALKLGLKDVDGFVHKCIQLYETTVVRHGLMLVGPTGSGKTQCYRTLQSAITALKGEMSPAGSKFTPVQAFVLNPKSITMGQLYGEFDLLTHEWTDGILSALIRGGVSATDNDKRWYMFDGPVDAVWIENMNTVLDDNKKLCLSSGEIIKMTEHMTMMFEVADLAVASPATVSRCGMVYLEPSILGLSPFVDCWLKKLPDPFFQFKDQLQTLFDTFLESGIAFLRKNVKEIVPTMDSNLTFSLLKMLESFFTPFLPKESLTPQRRSGEKGIPPERAARVSELIEPWFCFSIVWTLGASCDNDGMKKFSGWMRDTMSQGKISLQFPPEGLVYDYKLDDACISAPPAEEEEEDKMRGLQVCWRNWMDGLPEYVITKEMKYSDIIIPTMDTTRLNFLLEHLLTNNKTVLCVGPTGTGKTLSIADKLTRNMPKDYLPDFITFSAKTSANQTQDLIDAKLDKRRKGVFGPPLGKYIVFFIDDLNMPALETYGAQPPIELIRQWMDFKGWYDRKAIGEFRNLVDVNFICAMGPPGGGRNPVTPRVLRHFNYIALPDLEDDSKRRIFGSIFKFWLTDASSTISSMCDKLVDTCIDVYNTITTQLLPTPLKSHYTFNLRDLSKVFQGMLMADSSKLTDINALIRLWCHENLRVFQDRLVNDQDRDWFLDLIKSKMKSDFDLEYTDVVVKEPILYGDFLTVGVDNKPYVEMENYEKLVKTVEDSLEDYNQVHTAHMNLVLFVDAVRHLCRIGRIVRQPLGNALLLGLGGSGRQSLTRLAAHLSDFDLFQIELSKNYGNADWREDLKKVMKKAGIENQPTVFLFSDTQIKRESFLEDINNILNSGSVPNIYTQDELDNIYTTMKPIVMDAGLQPTKTNLFSTFTKRVRTNLHTVITMSPIGEVFRARLRQFPALVSCCTIDWFSEWPAEALRSVAIRFLNDIPDLDSDDKTMDGLVAMCQIIHLSVTENSKRFLAELSRHNYVTPTSYLELLGVFQKLLSMKKIELTSARSRTKGGLDKLLSTELEVFKLQKELEVMRPQLEEAVQEAMTTMAQIQEDTKIAEETKIVVSKEEASAASKAKECQMIADDAQRDLAEALPALDAAIASLKSLNRNDIVEVRAMMRPPDGVKLVMEAVCIMKNVRPKKVAGDKPGEKKDDYWEPGKNLMQDPSKFLDSLFTFDKDNIPDEVIKKISPYIEMDAFQPAAIAKVSKACTSICEWARAMYKYHHVALGVAPKREALRIAQIELAETQRILDEARHRLRMVEEGLATLQAKYDESVRKKNDLEQNCRVCEARLVRADKLIGGLGDEKIRWAESVDYLQIVIANIVGDILMSSATVAYLGPFTGDYRNRMVAEWVEQLAGNHVPRNERCTLVDTLSDPVKIRNWQIAGLPKDTLSTENAVIVQFSRRWPLFIDPQGQANKWIKNMEKENGLDIIKLSDKDFLRSLENAIRFGKPCLLENVGTELDPALEPVLLKQTFKQQGSTVIKLGDAVIPYHEDFKFYLTTKLPNPHFGPELSTKVSIINFTLSPSGLEDQLLAIVVAEERPDLEEAKSQLIVSNARMKQELKEIEDKILLRLSSSLGNPVDDVDLIQTLEASKLKSMEIKAKVVVAEQTEKDIDITRSQYIPVAVNTQILFFCVADLSNIDPMYQYSLEWFTGIFLSSIANAERADNIPQRTVNINNYFTFSLYSNVCRSLFEKHKLLFAFLLATRILQSQGKIDMEEWRYLLAGGTHKPKDLPNPATDWLSARSWGDILQLAALPKFAEIAEDFQNHLTGYRRIFDSADPHREELPGKWQYELDDFQRLLILRCLRLDRITHAFQDFVANHLGQRFIEPQTADLSLVFKESSAAIPLIFVLSQGTDPAADLYKFAEDMRFSKKLMSISLGQGQGPRAESMMKSCMERGKWVFFQNCHLAPSFMPALERLVEQINPDKVHRDFRLWLTSMPSPKFPVSILQNGSKMTVEPPRGIKANMLRSYAGFSDTFLNSCTNKLATFKHLLQSLCFFHGVILERRKFGPLGFNIPYEFTDGDLRICVSQLKMFLEEYEEIPYKVLKYTAGEINYGGRVTDDWDRRTAMNILQEFYNDQVLNTGHKYSESGIYTQIDPDNDYNGYMNYIKSLPINDNPEIFGLHNNANITSAQNETIAMFEALLLLQPKTAASGGKSREEVTEEMAKSILSRVPNPIPLGPVMEKYPVLYEQSMNTVLTQEIFRYNRLLAVLKQSLNDLLKALKGLVVLSQQLEEMANSIFNNQVPSMWAGKAYPSLKPLAAWVTDLVARVAFIQDWIDNGIPPVFWISGFFFPQAFLTGTLQNYARKMVISIDTISFGFKIMSEPLSKLKVGPEIGCYIRGLFIEGARWDPATFALNESRPKELFTEMPCIWLVPEANRQKSNDGIYLCPVYKTLTRAGTLSTTGHSTNYVFAIEVPSHKAQTHWIQRGVAMLCALNY